MYFLFNYKLISKKQASAFFFKAQCISTFLIWDNWSRHSRKCWLSTLFTFKSLLFLMHAAQYTDSTTSQTSGCKMFGIAAKHIIRIWVLKPGNDLQNTFQTRQYVSIMHKAFQLLLIASPILNQGAIWMSLCLIHLSKNSNLTNLYKISTRGFVPGH